MPDTKKFSGYATLSAGLAAAMVTGFLIYKNQQPEETYLLFSAADRINRGDVFSSEVLTSTPVPASFGYLANQFFTAGEGGLLFDRASSCNLDSGAFIQRECIDSGAKLGLLDAIKPGFRALAVSVSEEGAVAYQVQPGDRVDILGTVLEEIDGVEQERTALLFQNLLIAAVDRRTNISSADSRQRRFGTVTFLVTPEIAEEIVHIRRQTVSPFTLLLRTRGDDEFVRTEVKVTNSDNR